MRRAASATLAAAVLAACSGEAAVRTEQDAFEGQHAEVLAMVTEARRSVVAVGWEPEGPVRRRLESGWLASSDTVVTSHKVACDAMSGRNLQVRTLDGDLLRGVVEHIDRPCGRGGAGLGIIRIERRVDATALKVSAGEGPKAGEALVAVGHANSAAALGGWLAVVGPMVHREGDMLLVDLGVPVVLETFDMWFGGGYNGAPVLNLAGEVVAVLCCERPSGPQLRYYDPPAAPDIHRHLVLDHRYIAEGVGGRTLEDVMRRIDETDSRDETPIIQDQEEQG